MGKYFLIILFFGFTVHGQELHHQMLSAQGSGKHLTNGIFVRQTIGQQSTTGNYNQNKVVIGQGFQQSVWGKYISSNRIDERDDIKTIIYPNPFSTTINFQFSKPVTDIITASLFDIRGRLIFEQKKKVINNILTIDLSFLPTSVYLIRLNTLNLNYYTKIIKQ